MCKLLGVHIVYKTVGIWHIVYYSIRCDHHNDVQHAYLSGYHTDAQSNKNDYIVVTDSGF